MHKQDTDAGRSYQVTALPGTTEVTARGPQGQAGQGSEFLSLAEAGRLLGVGRCRAWELAHAGQLPAIRLGRRWYVPRRAIDALVDRALENSEVLARRGERP